MASRKIEVFFDGACHLWEKAGYGYWVRENGKMIHSGYGRLNVLPDRSTSNAAEHCALGMALKWLIENKLQEEDIVVFGDSKLVISQMFRGWRCRDESLPYVPFMQENKLLLQHFIDIRGKLIPRRYNEQADVLSKKGIRSKTH